MRTSVSREHGEREDDLIEKLGRKHAPDKQVVAEDYSHAAGAAGAHMFTRFQLESEQRDTHSNRNLDTKAHALCCTGWRHTPSHT